jgi:outer membrane receptor for ferrienterochelin and colicin
LRTTPLQADFQSPMRELDLHATWKMNPKARLRLSASNLLSQDALRGQRYSTEEGDLQSTRMRRGTPLFQLQLEIRP